MDHRQVMERYARRGRRHPGLPALAQTPGAGLSGSVPDPLAFPQLSRTGLRCRFAQPKRQALHSCRLYAHLAPARATRANGSGQAYRRLQYDDSQARTAPARRRNCTDRP